MGFSKPNSTLKLTVVGGGIGDPDLLTIKALKAIRSANVILYDALINEEILAYACAGVPRIFVGKRKGYKRFTQIEINQMIVEKAQRHGHVVRLKGGDPFVFGRGMEEILYAEEHGLETAYVPGISSAIAAAGLANIPVTHRAVSRGFWVISATTVDDKLTEDLTLAARSRATVVILMGLGKLSQIVDIFYQNDKKELPIAIIQNASLPNEKRVVGTVGTIEQLAAEQQIGTPAVIVAGETVALYNNNLFFEAHRHTEHIVY
ncbi:MAG: uroporphyrinogen-III C-methyltransferase [Bacteroidota bacterium]